MLQQHFQELASLSFGSGYIQESILFLEASVEYGLEEHKDWAFVLIASLYLYMKHHELSIFYLNQARTDAVGTQLAVLVRFLCEYERGDTALIDDGIQGIRMVTSWDPDSMLALQDLAQYCRAPALQNVHLHNLSSLGQRGQSGIIARRIAKITEYIKSFKALLKFQKESEIQQNLTNLEFEIHMMVEEMEAMKQSLTCIGQSQIWWPALVKVIKKLALLGQFAISCDKIADSICILSASFILLKQVMLTLFPLQEIQKKTFHRVELCLLIQLGDLYSRLYMFEDQTLDELCAKVDYAQAIVAEIDRLTSTCDIDPLHARACAILKLHVCVISGAASRDYISHMRTLIENFEWYQNHSFLMLILVRSFMSLAVLLKKGWKADYTHLMLHRRTLHMFPYFAGLDSFVRSKFMDGIIPNEAIVTPTGEDQTCNSTKDCENLDVNNGTGDSNQEVRTKAWQEWIKNMFRA